MSEAESQVTDLNNLGHAPSLGALTHERMKADNQPIAYCVGWLNLTWTPWKGFDCNLITYVWKDVSKAYPKDIIDNNLPGHISTSL